ncbi:hypothetical protein L917_05275 [Phytophthora nicotianae]|uniref:Uncharacterized protein n=1 Tax=Phytophthora nicotianae TaxID=4792 RepID=W2LL44_PHYNI|nr:hypothetical protein L917_05275 [Phytophthora nicotianae]
MDVYPSNLLKLDPQLDTELRRVVEGYQKLNNNLKKRGVMKINEGKRQLKINGFEMVAAKLMKLEPKTTGQAWSTVLFGSGFILMWNLMRLANSIDSIMLQHMECVEDCRVVEEQGHKGDQQGPTNLGSITDRFGRLLRRVIGSLSEEELRELSCTPEDIGTHSLRKGSSSYALGQVNGPTPVSVYLRMGQSLGRLKDRYIHFGKGQTNCVDE